MENQTVCKNCGADLVISEHLGKSEARMVLVEGRCSVCDGFVRHIDQTESRLIKQLEGDPITSSLWRLLK